MKPIERDILINDIWKGIYGISGTEEKGMIGDIKKIIEHQEKQNGSILINTIWRRIIVGVGSTGITALVLHLIGVY